MTSYFAPGVYVKEVPSGPRTIGRVSTSIAAFIGKAPKTQIRLDEAVAIDNWTQFADAYIGDATEGSHLANAVYGFFANGGGRCYVVNIGDGDNLTGTAAKPTGLRLLEALDNVSMVAAPGFTRPQDYAALLEHCEHELRQDRLAILDTPEDVPDIDDLLEAGGAPVPDSGDEETEDGNGETGGGGGGGRTSTEGTGPIGAPQSPGGYAAQYFPWIVVQDPVTGKMVTQPPSGHMAGIWARVDSSRGVHKAPANEPVQGVVNVVHQVTRGEQEILNPAGVNCIRRFPEGFVVWGARTRAPQSGEYRYINVRRLTNMIKESIAEGTKWAVFEPNDYTLWGSLRRDIGSFLTNVWRDGGLLGRTPEEAFFVKCDEETNPPEVRNEGQIVAVVGISVVRPAEFVIFKLMQSANMTEIESTGA
ncbi:phage tail sheath family protein [Arthrobacter crystallopoietes BAB-32]|uniref:Phage tail sheath family protein n=1 Tax=Arthrobacter crystallopoietes BAB-32 TaxID=1246476 RepID=N1V833_9MICC|nr:phage tail sheath subtilisin-like domain-containing protein [Arthrobacter crystallopoietes]EMY34403.1 phage tail sheath family protein [Arthrobacter crystallopoietes BAB-32]